MVFTDAANTISTSTNISYDGTDLTFIGNATFDDVNINGDTVSAPSTLSVTSPLLTIIGADGVNINTTDSDIVITPGTGIVKVISKTGLQIPVGNTVERPVAPETGCIRFNTYLDRAEIFNGTDWNGFSPDFAGIAVQEIVPDGIAQSYILDRTATSENIIVSINGIIQEPDNSYGVFNSTISFASIPLVTDIISIRFLTAISHVSAITDAYGDTLVQAINSTIILDVDGQNVITINDQEVQTAQDIIPATGNINLGSLANPYENIYVNNINGGVLSGFDPSSISDLVGDTKVQTNDTDITLAVDGQTIITIDATSISVETDILPVTDGVSDLGATGKRYDNLYVNNINGEVFDPTSYTGDIDGGTF